MRIEYLDLRNYRLFRRATWDDLPPFAVIVGANGSGKSTLFDALSFLKECLTENVSQAVARRGGLRELVSRGASGPVRITVKFRESGGRLATYLLEIGDRAGRPIVGREILRYTRRHGKAGRPWHFLDFSMGSGTAITNEAAYGQEGATAEREERVLDDPSTLAIKGLGQFREFPVVSEFRSLLEHWHISDFQISNARQSGDAGLSEHLSTRGDDVAQAAAYLYEQHPDRFRRILEVMRRRVPGVTRVEAKATEDGRLVLRFQDGSFRDPFIARYVSDGTIKMFASDPVARPETAPGAGGGGARESALSAIAERAGGGVPRLRPARRPGVRLHPLPRVPQWRESGRDIGNGRPVPIDQPLPAPDRPLPPALLQVPLVGKEGWICDRSTRVGNRSVAPPGAGGRPAGSAVEARLVRRRRPAIVRVASRRSWPA